MGLGKTIEMISLILSDLDDKHDYAPPKLGRAAAARVKAADAAFKKAAQARGLVASEGTLVVAPVSLVGQWESELRDKCGGKLKVVRWYGQRRERDAKKLAALGAEEGKGLVVLTTFETLGQMHLRAPERVEAWRADLEKERKRKEEREKAKEEKRRLQEEREQKERERKERERIRLTYGVELSPPQKKQKTDKPWGRRAVASPLPAPSHASLSRRLRGVTCAPETPSAAAAAAGTG